MITDIVLFGFGVLFGFMLSALFSANGDDE